MATEKQKAARERNWMIFQVRGALTAFNHRTLNIMTHEEQAVAIEVEGALQKLLATIERGSK